MGGVGRAQGCGGAAAHTALRNEAPAQALGWKLIPTIALSALAIVLSLVSLIVNAW